MERRRLLSWAVQSGERITPKLTFSALILHVSRCHPTLVNKVWPDKRHRMGVLASSTSQTKEPPVILFLFQPAENGRK